jgi:aminodeoxyfutalosine synthase
VLNEIKKSVDRGVLHIRLTGASRVTYDPDFWCRMLRRIKERFPVLVEALSAFEIHWMGSITGTPPEQLVSSLVAAGLDIVGGDGGDMLVDRVMAEGVPGFSSVQDWLGAIRWMHRFGGSSRALMRISRHDSWEDRLLHLHKLRTLQDEMPGIRSFALRGEADGGERLSAEVKLRCTALARIFLDNIPTLEECELAEGESTASALSLGAGVREVRVNSEDHLDWRDTLVGGFEHIGVTLSGDPSLPQVRR